MHRTKWLLTVMTVVAALLIVSGALADDFAPPPWNRNDPYAASYHWDLTVIPVGDMDVPDTPWGGLAPYGDPNTYPTWTPPGWWTPLPYGYGRLHIASGTWSSAPGGWQLTTPGRLDFYLPNFVDDFAFKHFRAQVTFSEVPLGISDGPSGDIPLGGVFDPQPITQQVEVTEFYSAAQKRYFDEWLIRPNPDWEIWQLGLPNPTGGAWIVKQIRIDTISESGVIPEPGTYVLFGLGALALLGIRRRRKAA